MFKTLLKREKDIFVRGPMGMARSSALAKHIVLVIIIAMLVSACASAAPPAPTASSQTKPQAEAPKPKAEEPKPKAEAKAPAKIEPLNPPVTVKVGDMGIVAESGLYIAQDRGYFKELGINVETVPFDTGPRVLPALAAGQVDVGFGALGAGFFNAVQRGIDLKVVSAASILMPGVPYCVVAVRKDLIDDGKVKEPKDLKGKNVAVAAMDGGGAIEVDLSLAQGGVSIKDTNAVVMPYPDMLVAFGNKTLDAALLIEPFVSTGVEKKVIVPWKIVGDAMPAYQASFYLYSSQFATSKPEVAKRFLVALLKGQRDYEDAFFNKKGNQDSIVAILSKATKTDQTIIRKTTPPNMAVDGSVISSTIARDQDWYANMGFVKDKVDLTKLIDNQFADYAVGILGKYQK